MEELQNFNLHALFEKLRLSDEQFEEWLKQIGLLHTQRICECGKAMRYKWTKQRVIPQWQCTSAKNHNGKRIVKGYYEGTFFERAHLIPKQIFEFSYYWARAMFKQKDFCYEMKLNKKTVVDWKSYCRDICIDWFQSKSQMIGAGQAIVEIDETCITKRKFKKGRLIKCQQWYFGGIERGTSKCFIVPVKKRDAATLLPIIQKFICPGAVIVSDCWAAYKKIRNLPEMYEHYTVNHSENFVDPTSGQHTQTIESTWQKFKSGHKSRYGTHRSVFASYLCDFLWRRQHDGPNVFFHFWSQIAELYPVNS